MPDSHVGLTLTSIRQFFDNGPEIQDAFEKFATGGYDIAFPIL